MDRNLLSVRAVSKTKRMIFCISFYLLRRGLFVLWGSWGEKKESARGTMGRGKREERPLPSSHRTPRAFYFFDYCYFYWDTQREPLRRSEQLIDVYRYRRSLSLILQVHSFLNESQRTN